MLSEPAVHVVDDDADVLRSLSFLLRAHKLEVHTYQSALVFLDRYAKGIAGCILSDVRMPGMDGLDLLRHLHGAGSSLPFIVMTGHADVPLAVEAMKEGAMDFIEKPYGADALLGMVRRGLASWDVVSEAEAKKSIVRRQLDLLSPRERSVLEAVAEGRSSKTIALDLGLSVRTVEVHRANILVKLEVENTAFAVAKLIASRD